MDTQETKIRKGQSYNLAMADAIHNNRENDVKHIYKRFIFYYELGGILQGSDLDMIQEVVDSPDLEKIMKQLKEVMK